MRVGSIFVTWGVGPIEAVCQLKKARCDDRNRGRKNRRWILREKKKKETK